MGLYKFDLLRHAWRQGCGTFARQALLLGKHLLGRKTVLVFAQCPLSNTAPYAPDAAKGLHIQRYDRYQDIPEAQRAEICRNRKWFFWDTREWLTKGGRLWIATVDGNVAALAWTFCGAHKPPWFLELRDDDSLIWWTVTLPRYRGRGIQSVLYSRMVHDCASRGSACLYVSCAEYNLSSMRVILRAGFAVVGVGRRTRDGRVLWQPTGGKDGLRLFAARPPASRWPP